MSTPLKKAIIVALFIVLLTIIIFQFRSSSSSNSIQSSTAKIAIFQKSFIYCFQNLTNRSNVIFLPGTSSYQSTLLSSLKNRRFLYSLTNSKPSLIVSPAIESHVQAAVMCARRSNLSIRPRSGGHDYEGLSYSARGANVPFITIDISALRSISFDDNAATAWVQAGATLGELYHAIVTNNRTAAFPAGFCPTVGVGGHVSGGGMGSLTRKFGTAADNVVDALLVDADGRLLDRKAMGEELFWAIRGAGSAGFGVIVAFKIKLVQVPEKVTVFNVLTSTANQNFTKLVSRWQRVAHQLDENLFIRLIAEAQTDKDGTRKMKAVFSSLYLGRRETLLSLARRSFPELGLSLTDCKEMSWLESVLFFHGDYGKSPKEVLLNRRPDFNISFKSKSDFVGEPIPDSGLEEIWRFLMNAKEEPLTLIMEPFGGKMNEISENEIAFPHRKGNLYNIQYYMHWAESSSEEEERHLEWMKRLYDFMTPYVSKKPRAAYYNYKDMDLGRNVVGNESSFVDAEVWGTKYFKGHFRKLAKLKGEVDAGNFFWNEQSVPPLLV